jgi:hypothetical protein
MLGHVVHRQIFGEGSAGLRHALLWTAGRGRTRGMAAAGRR